MTFSSGLISEARPTAPFDAIPLNTSVERTRPTDISGEPVHRRIASLDGLRAISIAFVLIDHLGYDRFFTPQTLLGTTLASLGGFGVKIFFVLSGYLITLLMLNEQNKTGKVNLGNFYIRRVFRIVPAAIAFMLVVFIYNGSSISLQNKVFSLLFIENYASVPDWRIAHLWSLGVEEQFYLLWPLVFIIWPQTRKKALLLTMAVVPAVNVVMIRLGWPYWNLAFYSVADTIACGCLLALLRQNQHLNRVLNSRFFFLIPILTCLDSPLTLLKGGIVFGVCKSLLLRPAFNIGIALCVEKAVRIAPAILNNRTMTSLGVMSYSIYLWQQPFAFSRTPLAQNSLLDLIFRIVLIGIFASASYLCVEQPFLKMRYRMLQTN